MVTTTEWMLGPGGRRPIRWGDCRPRAHRAPQPVMARNGS